LQFSLQTSSPETFEYTLVYVYAYVCMNIYIYLFVYSNISHVSRAKCSEVMAMGNRYDIFKAIFSSAQVI
jgi:Ni/Fe-hydrogenase subunit HybB-like protein